MDELRSPDTSKNKSKKSVDKNRGSSGDGSSFLKLYQIDGQGNKDEI
jgi:hypothetical protein